ncbi:MAG: lipopolysaccharide kinase InaA family protein [Candidatus Binatia bacterium]
MRRWLQNRLWGETPEGFERFFQDRNHIVMVRRTLKDSSALREMWAVDAADESAYHGRSKLRSVAIAAGEKALVRGYRRGGVPRYLTADLFFTWPPRPFRELCITEAARRRGVPTLEVLGACVERTRGPFYRGWLATRQLAGSQDLWAVLNGGAFSSEEKKETIASAALAIRKMHRHGIFHADLNLRNILARREETGIQSYVIDLDKAKLYSQALSVRQANQNLRRLLRSVAKLDPGRVLLTAEDWHLFLRRYGDSM